MRMRKKICIPHHTRDAYPQKGRADKEDFDPDCADRFLLNLADISKPEEEREVEERPLNSVTISVPSRRKRIKISPGTFIQQMAE